MSGKNDDNGRTRSRGLLGWALIELVVIALLIGWIARDWLADRALTAREANSKSAPSGEQELNSAAVVRSPALKIRVASAGSETLSSPHVQALTEPPVTTPSLNEPRAILPQGGGAPLAVGGLAGGAAAGGSVLGRVFLEGTPPPEQVIPMDPVSLALQTNTPTTRFFVISADGGLADVVVYLEGKLPPMLAAAGLPPQIIDHQRGFKVPYVSAVVVGQQVLLTNSDRSMHNNHVVTQNKPANPEQNIALMPGKASTPLTFFAPEDFIRLKCDVHPWEFAYVSVFPHRYFAVTDAEGSFAITNVPPGRYQLHAKHRKALSDGPIEIEVKSNQSIEANVRLRPPS